MSVKEIPKKETPEVTEDFLKFVEDYIYLLKQMGNFIVTMGNTEQKHPDMFEQVKKLGSPEVLETLVDRVPPEILTKMFKTLIRFARLSQVNNIMALPPAEKISIGKEMMALSEGLNELMNKVKG